MSTLTDAVRQALASHDMLGAVTDVKQLLCDELSRVDPNAQVNRTEYFNHSYVPDIVVAWPNGAREVFLRFVSSAGVAEDTQRIGRSGPVVIDLSAATTNAGQPEVAAEVVAVDAVTEEFPQVLRTDTEATEHIRPANAQNMVERLVVSNLLRSGRGQLTETAAHAAVEVSRAGFDAAIAAEPDPVSAVVHLTRGLLNVELERRVEKSLQLLWWAGGGAPNDFPVTLIDDMELNADDTREFLRMVFTDDQPIDDEGFWGRLADRIDYDMLVASGEVAGSSNLNRLMRALAGRLELSHAVVDLHDPPLPPYDELRWSLTDSFLRLSGATWACKFTPHGNRFSQRRDEGPAVPLTTVTTRSEGLFVDEAELEEADRRVHLSRKAVDPAAHQAATLPVLAAGFAEDARVRSLVVQVGQHRLTAEFDRMMLASDPDSPVLRMATIATRLLAALSAEEQQELAEFLDG